MKKKKFDIVREALFICCLFFSVLICCVYVCAAPVPSDVSEICDLTTTGCKKKAGKSCPENKTCKSEDGVCDCFP
jgi:hypothetical protein